MEIIFAIFSVVPPQLKYITRVFEFWANRPHDVSIIIAVAIRIDFNFILCPPYD